MKLLPDPTNSPEAEVDCAALLMEVVPSVMRVVRAEMRRHRAGLTVPQFRALAFVQRSERPSLSELADFLGLTLSAVSRMVDGLVQRGYVIRSESATDRRFLVLQLTPAGGELVAEAQAQTRERLAELLSGIQGPERE